MEEWVVLGESDSDADTVQFLNGSDTASDNDSEISFTIVQVGRSHAARRVSSVGSVNDAPPPRTALVAAAVPQAPPPGFFKVVSYGEALSSFSCADDAGSSHTTETDATAEYTNLLQDEELRELVIGGKNQDVVESSDGEEESDYDYFDLLVAARRDGIFGRGNIGRTSSDDGKVYSHGNEAPPEPEFVVGEHENTKISDEVAESDYNYFDLFITACSDGTFGMDKIGRIACKVHGHIAEPKATTVHANGTPLEFGGGKHEDFESFDEAESEYEYFNFYVLAAARRAGMIDMGKVVSIACDDGEVYGHNAELQDSPAALMMSTRSSPVPGRATTAMVATTVGI